MAVDLKSAENALTHRTQQKELERMQKDQENHEQMSALKSFKAVLDAAKQL
jgi:hypothetical protein